MYIHFTYNAAHTICTLTCTIIFTLTGKEMHKSQFAEIAMIADHSSLQSVIKS